jgi:hypothetical protein
MTAEQALKNKWLREDFMSPVLTKKKSSGFYERVSSGQWLKVKTTISAASSIRSIIGVNADAI